MPKNVELSLSLSDGSVKKLPFTIPDGPQGIEGEKGEKGNQGNSAYDDWFALNTDILAFLSELKAVDVMSPQLLQKLIDETTLGLTFDDYLTHHLLRDFYDDLNNQSSLPIQEFLINSGLEDSVLNFMDNSYSIEGYSILLDLFLLESAELIAEVVLPNNSIQDVYQVCLNAGMTISKQSFLDNVFPSAIPFKNTKYHESSLDSFFAQALLKHVYIYKGFADLSFVDSTGINPVNKYLDSRKSTDVNISGLTAYGVDVVINNWIEENYQDWFKSVPLSMVAQNWVNNN